MSTLEAFLSVFSLCSLGCGIFFSIRGALRDKTKDQKEDVTQMSLVMFKLDNIDSTVNEIKTDSRAFRNDMQDARERILILEQEQKNSSERISLIEKNINKED